MSLRPRIRVNNKLTGLVGVCFEHALVTISSNLCQLAVMSEEVWVKDQSTSDRCCLMAPQLALCRFMLSNACVGMSVCGVVFGYWNLSLQSTMSWSERRVFSTDMLWMELECLVNTRSKTRLLSHVGSSTN